MRPATEQAMLGHLTFLYGEAVGREVFERLRAYLRLLPLLPNEIRKTGQGGEVFFITYPDGLCEPGVRPLRTLARFCEQHLAGLISGVHLLPFYPWSSDDGFSVVDYRVVDPRYGTWEDVRAIGQHFRLMFDAVINHVSGQSEWFRAFLRDDPQYRRFFIVVEGDPDLSQVVRPRALPLLTSFDTPSGAKRVWTTFSADQIDLNYLNPDVLLEILDLLLFYISRGAEYLRLDAIAYLWKQIGTPCIHLPQTHRVIQLFRAVLNEVAPQVKLITETNVPHAENISYFGDGAAVREAHLVYNFALPPLVLDTFHTGSARALSEWAASLRLPSDRVAFFNFLASHDGIGLNPARRLLSDEAVNALVQKALAHGGLVSYKQNSDGTQSPYELNINYFDALSNPAGDEPLETQAARFLAAHAILLSLAGVPAVYFHSLFGSRGWPEGVRLAGHHRAINRQKLERNEVERELNDPRSLRARVFEGFRQMLAARNSTRAFSPDADQRVLDCGVAVFALLRSSPAGDSQALCLHNVSDRTVETRLPDAPGFYGSDATDLLTRQRISLGSRPSLRLRPYECVWLAAPQGRKPADP